MACAKRYGWIVAATSALLAACGGGGEQTSRGPAMGTSTPVVAVGRIDAFGSVFVNGVEYDTNGASYRVDDRPAFGDSALAVGMIVRLRGTHDGNGRGRALEIRYDDEVEGPVTGLEVDPADATLKRFTVLGVSVVASSATTVFRSRPGTPFTFADLADGDHVEVSGDFDGDTLLASYIKREEATGRNLEVRGIVANATSTGFTLLLRNGRSIQVTFAAGVSLPATALTNGAFVEVEGTLADLARPLELLVTRVELEDRRDLDGDGRGDRSASGVDLKGVLAVNGDTWSVRDIDLSFSAATRYRPLGLATAIADRSAAGLRVRVRGAVVDGVLQVAEIVAHGRADGRGDLWLQGFVETVTRDATAGTTTIQLSFAPALGTVDVLVTAETLLKNDAGVVGWNLSTLTPGASFIEVHGALDANGKFVARVLEIEDRSGPYVIEGPLDVDGYVPGVSISVLGVKFSVGAGTRFDRGTPAAGNIVGVGDGNRDGFADLVKVGDLRDGPGHD